LGFSLLKTKTHKQSATHKMCNLKNKLTSNPLLKAEEDNAEIDVALKDIP